MPGLVELSSRSYSLKENSSSTSKYFVPSEDIADYRLAEQAYREYLRNPQVTSLDDLLRENGILG